MLANVERAMTHYGDGTACVRPKEVRELAVRVMAWGSQQETCKSCMAHPVISIVSGEPLCVRCKAERSVRVATVDGLRRIVMTRAEPMAGTGFRGHMIVFDKWSVDLGGFIERVRPEAVNRSLNTEHDMLALWNHDSSSPIGRLSARTMSVWKDAVGLGTSIIPPAWGSGSLESVQRGDVKGMSFGFRTIEDEWNFDGKVPQRDLVDIVISEGSAVAFPAYPDTDLRVEQAMRAEPENRVSFLQRWHKTKLAG